MPCPKSGGSRRIVIVGQSCSGKSTLGASLVPLVGGEFADLDALGWKPGWQPSSDEEFQAHLRAVAARGAWVASGQYHRHASVTLWPRADTVIWLDILLRLITWRILRRPWTRWRKRELLWGTNTEKFWEQLKVWRPEESLIGYAFASRKEVRERYLTALADPRWAHIRFIRLRSSGEIKSFVQQLESGEPVSSATGSEPA